MRQMILALLASLLIAPAAAVRVEAKAETHRHPDLPVQFKTFEGWHRVPRPGDEGTFEMASPGDKVTIMVWHTSTEQDARKYLMKMADMEPGHSFRAAWFPGIGAHEDPGLMHSIRFAGTSTSSPPVTLHASRKLVMEGADVVAVIDRLVAERGAP